MIRNKVDVEVFDENGVSMPTQLAKDIDIAEYKARYDKYAKQILANKDILARILSATVIEYKDIPLEEIKNLIEDDISVGSRSVEPSTSGKSGASFKPSTSGKSSASFKPSASGKSGASKIYGMNTESIIPGEGRIVYDIKFSAYVPSKDEYIKLIINLEAQQRFDTPYDLVTRGVLYTCRMISEQLGRELEIDKKNSYDNLKKVYSIWICMDTPQDVANSITEFKMTKNSIYGKFRREARYDLQSIIFVCLGKAARHTKNELIGMLDTLLASDIDIVTKEERLSNIYNLKLRETSERTVDYMCNLSEGIWERGLNEGREQGRQEGREQGRQEGRQEGIRIGEVKNLIKLVEQNIITKEQAYEVTTLTPKEFDEQYAQWVKASKQ